MATAARVKYSASAEYLTYEILSVVEEIPEGKVASYGQIARLIGREKNARIAPHFYEQKNLLLAERVEFKDDTHVDLKKYRWDC